MNSSKEIKDTIFKCHTCGKCCQNLNKSDIYKHLDNGKGVCKYYDIKNKKCKIYGIRPIICNVDLMYKLFLSNFISKENYYLMNYKGCKKLK